MSILKAEPEQVVIPPTPIETDMTLQEFLESDLEGYEYVKGALIPMPPTSGEHGDISANLFLPLGTHVRENQLGRVYTSDTGFKIDDRFLIPDIAFVSIERLPDDRRKAFSIPPDLAVEIVSPTDVLFRVFEKALTYLSGGTQLVWVIEPVAKTVTVYRSETDIKTLTREEMLTGEDIIEGFSCEISQLFE
ncbi:MAG: Uma2 family endonuclease [Candidatus Poribacteria bacterium]|nr:Uma2 family endonuclease [Candidatus Poribacteria bacterium]